MNTIHQRRGEIQAEFETVQKKLAELEARQADLKGTLMRLNLYNQVQGKGVARSIPTGFIAGDTD